MVGSSRFLTLIDVAEVLNTSSNQVRALVRRGDLEAIQIGGRGQWRVEDSKLEEYIAKQYLQTKQYVDEYPPDDKETHEKESEAEEPPAARLPDEQS